MSRFPIPFASTTPALAIVLFLMSVAEAAAADRAEITPGSLTFEEVSPSAALQLVTASVFDADSNATTPTSWTWESSDENVATVQSRPSEPGVPSHSRVAQVSAVGEGTATITFTAETPSSGNSPATTVTATAMVTVTLDDTRLVVSSGDLTLTSLGEEQTALEVATGDLSFASLGEIQTVSVRVYDENNNESEDASFGVFGRSDLIWPGDGGSPVGPAVEWRKVPGGLEVKALGNGDASIEIVIGNGQKVRLRVSVDQVPTTLTVTPDSLSLDEGETSTLRAAMTDANGHAVKVADVDEGGHVVKWETSDSAVATVEGSLQDSNYGYEAGGTATVTAVGEGAVMITASWSSLTATAVGTTRSNRSARSTPAGATLTKEVGVTVAARQTPDDVLSEVSPAGVRLEVSPAELRFSSLGETQTVSIRVYDENGNEIEDPRILVANFSSLIWPDDGTPPVEGVVEWRREPAGGLVELTALGNGTALIAISEGESSRMGEEWVQINVSVVVRQVPTTLTVTPESLNLVAGEAATLQAAMTDANGHEIDLKAVEYPRVAWETSDSAVATVEGSEQFEDGTTRGDSASVTAVAAGSATITARYRGWTTSENFTTSVETLVSPETATQTSANTAPMGLPTVSGTPEVGETLTASSAGITDADGLTNATYAWQWIANDGTSDADIAGATGATYTLTAAEAGKTIKVRVTFTDDGGTEETLESAATVAVEAGLTASFEDVPASHDGSSAFRLRLAFSEEVFGGNEPFDKNQAIQDALVVNGGAVTGRRRVDRNEFDEWWFKVAPSGNGAVTVSLPAQTDCEAAGAVCTPDGAALASPVSATVPGPVSQTREVSIAAANNSTTRNVNADSSQVTEGTAAEYTLTRTGSLADALTVNVSVTETGTMLSGTVPETVTFNANSPTAELRVETEDDEVAEPASTITAALAAGNGYSMDTGAASASVTVEDDDAAPVVQTAAIVTAPENTTAVATLTATDDDSPVADLAWSMVGGADSALFTVSAGGDLAFASAKDFEAPDDADTDGDYEVTVRVTDGANAVDAALTVRLADVDDVSPVLTDANVNGDALTLTFGEPLDGGSVPAASAFSVTVDEAARGISDVSLSGGAVTLTLASAAVSGETVTVGYTVPTGANARPLRDAAENAVAGFSNRAVTNATPASNAAPVGLPTVSGTPEVGETLTASSAGVTDTDGLANATYAWQWIANDGTADTDIAGGTAKTYTLTSDEVGKTIKVRATFTDDRGTEETVLSDATAAVTTAYTCTTPNLAGRTEVWTGTLTVATAEIGGTVYGHGFSREPSGGGDYGVLSDTSFDFGGTSYVITAVVRAIAPSRIPGLVVMLDKSLPDTERDMLRLHVCGDTFDLASVDVNANHSNKNKRYWWANPGIDWSAATTVSLALSGTINQSSTGAPAIAGTPQVGQTLTASPGDIADGNGIANATYAWQWIANDGTSDTDISGATGATYTLTAAEAGKTIKVRVTFTDDGGTEETLESAATAVVNTVPTGLPLISGTAQVGETLTASSAGITDADGLTNATYAWQWIANDGTSDADIAGATGAEYTLTAAEAGKAITVRVTFTDDAETEEVLVSEPTVAVNTVPTGLPLISGTAQVGETLTASSAGITDADGLTNATYAWQWIANDGTSDTDISGATEATYTLTAAEAGKTIKVRVTFTDDGGTEETLESAATAAVNTVPTGLPVTSGTAQVGETLAVSSAGIADADGLANATFAWQWIANDGTSDTDISGATGAEYTLTSAEEGKTIKVRVTFTDDGGTEETLVSEATAAVTAALPSVSVAAVSSPVTEGTAASFRLSRSGDTAPALTVAVSVTVEGAVVSTTPASSVTFAAGSAEATLNVATVDDSVAEADARVSVAVKAGSGYLVGSGSGSAGVDVYDNDAVASAPVETLWTSTLEWQGDYGAGWVNADEEDFSSPGWSEDGHDYRIWYIAYGSSSDELWVRADPNMRAGGIPASEELTLRVGDVTVESGAMAKFARGDIAVVRGIEPSWAVGEQVEVRLTRTTAGETTVTGPGVSVADAQVQEAEGAVLAFRVTLAEAQTSAVSVRYATSDGTATAGTDYKAVSGALRFAPGEVQKTVSVPVLNDAHDEGSETLTLALSRPFGAELADGDATGTIVNTDPMPKAWITRFGRTVGSQVVDAVTARFEDRGRSHVTVGGMTLGSPGPYPMEQSVWNDWETERSHGVREMTERELLLGSSFHLSSAERANGGPVFAAWGRVANDGFEGDVDDVKVEGDVTTGLLGFDAEWDRMLAGLVLSQSRGEGSYTLGGDLGNDRGTVESTLTGVYPFARLEMSERVSAWGLAGVGQGELTLQQEGETRIDTDLAMRMGALGVKGTVLDGSGPSGVGLNVKSDAMWVRTESDSAEGLESAEGDVTRLRLIVEGERVFVAGDGATFTPSGQVGLRHDGGDAETGAGVEMGAGISYTSGALTIEGQVRTLVAHQDSGYREWGASGAIRVNPDSSGRGLSLTLAPTWGQAASRTERLWSDRDATAIATGGEVEPAGRLEATLGYGMALLDGRLTGTPEFGLGLSESGRDWRLGWRLGLARSGRVDFGLGVEATRREPANDDAPENRVGLTARMRW